MIRNGDIEALRNRASLDGKPMKSTSVIDREGNRVDFRIKKNGKPEVIGVNREIYREDRG